MKADIYQRITDRIVSQLEQGVRPWLKPWNAEHMAGRITRPLRWNGKPYSGVNVIMLWDEAKVRGFACLMWMTFKQALELGGHVRMGERGSLVVYADRFTKTDTDAATGEETERQIPFLKGYTVFNCEQIDGLPQHYYVIDTAPKVDAPQRVAHAEAFFAATKATILHGGNRAYYARVTDHIQMPPFESFRDAESYCQTVCHELTHWSGGIDRLNREFGKRFGDDAYAFEELVAELGSAFLCADIGLTPEPRDDHASYLASWVKVLKNEKRAIFTAASKATQAADYLASLQPSATEAAA